MGDRCRLILHCGVPKTATTSLQHHLYAHTETLAAAGIACPKRMLMRGEVDPLFPALRDLRHARDPAVPAAAVTARLAALAAGHRGIIVSMESILGEAFEHNAFFGAARRSATLLAPVVADYDVHLVVTLRRPDELLRSNYAQYLRMGGTATYPAYLEPWLARDLGWIRYLRALRLLAPASSAILHYDRIRDDLGPLLRAVVGELELGPLAEAIERRNASFDDRAFGLARGINRACAAIGIGPGRPLDRMRRLTIEAAARLVRPAAAANEERATAALFERLRETCDEENRRLAEVSGRDLDQAIKVLARIEARQRAKRTVP